MTDPGAGTPDGQPSGPQDDRIEELKLRLDRLQARLDAHLAEGAESAAAPAESALGVILLGSAYLFGRFRPSRPVA